MDYCLQFVGLIAIIVIVNYVYEQAAQFRNEVRTTSTSVIELEAKVRALEARLGSNNVTPMVMQPPLPLPLPSDSVPTRGSHRSKDVVAVKETSVPENEDTPSHSGIVLLTDPIAPSKTSGGQFRLLEAK